MRKGRTLFSDADRASTDGDAAPGRSDDDAGAPRRIRGGPELLAGVLAVIGFCASMAVQRRSPFGPNSRLINDLGNQFTPMLAELRDVLTGAAPGDLLFSWTSGAGVPFLPDYTTYLGGPLSFLVVLFPRDQVDLAIFVITALKFGLAGAAMTWFLRVLRPRGSVLMATALGVSYALCGWAVDDGAYVPMWLDGLIAFPVFGVITEWARHRRRFVLGIVLVAVLWWGNFYTSYMASVGAALLLIARLAGEGENFRRAVQTVGRFAAAGVLGVALNAILLYPTVLAVGAAQPATATRFVARPWEIFAARLLPLTEGVGVSPSIYVGTVALLLALSFPFVRRVPLRMRVVLSFGLALVVASMQWPVTQAAWHGFDVPNGSPFRQAFVVCGWLIVMAWYAVQQKAEPTALLAAGLLMAALAWFAGRGGPEGPGAPLMNPRSLVVLGSVALFAASALVLLRLARPSQSLLAGRLVAWLLVALVTTEGTMTASVVDRVRAERLAATPSWGNFSGQALAAARESRWPRYRLNSQVGPPQNGPAAAGAPGVDYYSSTMPSKVSRALIGLGAPWAGYGRAIRLDPADVAIAAILSVEASFSKLSPTWSPTSDGAQAALVQPGPALPLVRLLPRADGPARGDGDVWARRDLLLGDQVYERPSPRIVRSSGTATLSASCRPGTLVQTFLPKVPGTVRLAEGPQRTLIGLPGQADSGVLSLGETPASGEVVITVHTTQPGRISSAAIGCLDLQALDRVVGSTSSPTTLEASGHTVSATWSRPVSGTAVIATAQDGAWECTVDGRPVDDGATAALLSVPLSGAVSLRCSHATRGLRLGATASGSVVALLLGLTLWGRRRGRRVIKTDAPVR